MAMDEKDKRIRELFDGYADGLEARPDLAERARRQIERRDEKYERDIKTAALRKNRRAVYIGFGSLAAAAVVAVFAVGVLPRLAGGKTSNGNDGAEAPPLDRFAVSYNIADVRAVSVSYDFARSYIDMSAIKSSAEVFAERYYACYIRDGAEPVYVKALFGVATDHGTLEMSIIIERDGYRRDDLAESYYGVITYDGNYRRNTYYENGEYITAAYFNACEKNYYVYSMSGGAGTEAVIDLIYSDQTVAKNSN